MRAFFTRCISRFGVKRSAIEAGLRLLIQVYQHTEIRKLRGKVKWSGNLAESRLGHIAEPSLTYTDSEERVDSES